MGRSAHQPDTTSRRQLEAMAGYGIREADIARVLEIDPKTLRRHYRKELDKGHIKANTKVAENLYRRATGEGREAVTAAIFWLKTRAGWRETVETKSEVRYVARMPAPINDIDEWLRIYAPKTIEHQSQPSTTPTAPMGLSPLRLIRTGDS
jgi:hypothetical protein